MAFSIFILTIRCLAHATSKLLTFPSNLCDALLLCVDVTLLMSFKGHCKCIIKIYVSEEVNSLMRALVQFHYDALALSLHQQLDSFLTLIDRSIPCIWLDEGPQDANPVSHTIIKSAYNKSWTTSTEPTCRGVVSHYVWYLWRMSSTWHRMEGCNIVHVCLCHFFSKFCNQLTKYAGVWWSGSFCKLETILFD